MSEITDKHKQVAGAIFRLHSIVNPTSSLAEKRIEEMAEIIAKHFPEPMDETRARTVLGDWIEDDATLNFKQGVHIVLRFVPYRKSDRAELSGIFTAEQLEAVAWWMKNKSLTESRNGAQ